MESQAGRLLAGPAPAMALGLYRQKGKTMGRLIKVVLVLILFGFIGLTGYAYLADFAPPQAEVTKDVKLNAD